MAHWLKHTALFHFVLSLCITNQRSKQEMKSKPSPKKAFRTPSKMLKCNQCAIWKPVNDLYTTCITEKQHDTLFLYYYIKQSDYSFLSFMFKGNYNSSSWTTFKIATCYSLPVWLVSLTKHLTSWCILVWFKPDWETISLLWVLFNLTK